MTLDSTSRAIVARVFATATDLFGQTPQPDIFAIDIPIGLASVGSRNCDLEARRLLGPLRSSSVFPAPLRPYLTSPSYVDANTLGKHLHGKGLSKQSWAILPKIKEVDAALCSDPALAQRVYEVHPEICFWAMNGGKPMEFPKRSIDGHLARRALIDAHFGPGTYETARRTVSRSAAAEDDILDALAAGTRSQSPRRPSSTNRVFRCGWSISAYAPMFLPLSPRERGQG